MHLKFIRLALFACSSLLIFSATAVSAPAPVPIPSPVPYPTPTVPPIIDPGPTPTVPPVQTPTVPPVQTPTVPPVPPTPTVPPISPPPVVTPTIPPAQTPTVPPISTPSLLTRPNPQLATAVIQYGQGSTLAPCNDRGRFQKVALQPSEVVTVMMTLSLIDVGKPANVQVVDGGAISADVPKPKDILPSPSPTATIAIAPIGTTNTASPVATISPSPPPSFGSLVDTDQILTVSQGGQLVFRFVPGADVGLHRVSVIVGGNQYFFQFWRQDMNAPNNNRSMLRAY